MKRLTITGVRELSFGRHDSRSFDGFDAPFVVVHGPNESGKSTLAEFLLWAIGGPFRSFANNSDAFRRSVDGAVRGRLLGMFDGQNVDIDAQFRLLTKGVPNDNRKGTIGAAEVDAAKLAERFGSLTASDYELIYRLYGASLGDVGSAELFSDVFSRFALGSASASINPRSILDGLTARSKKASDRAKKLTTERNKLRTDIKDASRAPEEIERLTKEIGSLNEQIAEVEGVAREAAAQAALFARVRDGLGHLEALRAAEGFLGEQADVSPGWESLVANEHRVRELVATIADQRRLLEEAEHRSSSSSGACGMPYAALSGRTLTPVERAELSAAVGAVLESRRTLRSADDELGSANDALGEAAADEARRVESLGLSGEQVAHLDAISATFPGLFARATRWVESVNAAIGLEAQVKGEEAKVGAPAPAPAGNTRAPSVSPWLVVGLLVAVGVLGAVDRVVGIAAAIVGAGAYVYVASRGRTSTGTSGDTERNGDQVLVNLTARAAEERENARQHRAELDAVLGVLSNLIGQPDTAAAQLARLNELAHARAMTAERRNRVDAARGRVEAAGPAVDQAEEVALRLFTGRGIPAEVLTEGFDQWLAKYETAVNDVAEVARLRDRLSAAQTQWADIVDPVRNDVDGMSPADVETRLASVSGALRARRDAEMKVREARVSVAAANMDSVEVEEILATHRTSAELQVMVDTSESDVESAKKRRDELVERRLAVTGELNAKLGTEVLPGLHLEMGRIQEEFEEAEQESAALALAVSVLSEVIDTYERDNQDPVVSAASALISQVVPDWGSILMSRTDKGVPMVERVGPDGRFEDFKISDGGRALLYTGIRLAFAQKDAERRGVSLPIICDDPFVHFDDGRTEAGLRLLASVASQNQVILMTCEKEVRDLAVSMGASVVAM